jgi:hypothetical protein
MSETLEERLNNLEMFLNELYKKQIIFGGNSEIADQASYHLATMDCLNKWLKTKGLED